VCPLWGESPGWSGRLWGLARTGLPGFRQELGEAIKAMKTDEEIIAAATKGPWGRFRDGLDTVGGPIFLFSEESDREQGRADAEFMARARERWPAAAEEIKNLCGDVDIAERDAQTAHEIAAMEIKGLKRCVGRWQKGDLIESDFVTEDGGVVGDPYAEIERLREALGLIARNGEDWTRGWIVDRAKNALNGGKAQW